LAPSAQRLQKVLAAAGVGSRRECEELILQGRIEVDRTVVTALGTRVDPQKQEIRVDGTALPRPRRVYYMLNKPAGVVCTNRDPAGRTRVVDLIRSPERLFAVGRLDRSSEGLILVTNDGALANQLTHPRYGIEKTYLVRVAGSLNPQQLAKLLAGVHLAEGVVRASAARVRHRHKQSTDLEIVLDEGRNREIRRMLARVGHKVMKLKRIAVGPLRLGDLPVGASRQLTAEEVRSLQHQAVPGRPAKRRRGGKSPQAATGLGVRRESARTRRPSQPKQDRPESPRGAILDYDDEEW
jgi:23S rRNA pseudouridine2605 synthase